MSVTLNANGLKKYLKTVLDLEKSLYEQNILLNNLYKKLPSLGVQYTIEKPKKPRSILSIPFWIILLSVIYGILGAIAAVIIGAILIWLFALVLFIIGFFIYIPSDILNGAFPTYFYIVGTIGAIIGIVIAVFGTINEVIEDRSGYENKIEQYHRDVKNYDARYEYETNVLIPECQREIKSLENNISQTKSTLNKLYSYNVIYPKYRTVVAMSMLYEYLESGRATQLEGHEGALNLYESELRLNTIIGKLDDVIYHLEDIKYNQSVLYELISDANQKTHKILSSTASRLESMDKQLSRTNSLLELNQYNSATAAKNLSVLAYYRQLEYGHR